MRLWHGSAIRLDAFSGPVHLGSLEQAKMRNHAWLHEVEIPDDLRLSRVRDDGRVGAETLARAARRGFDGVVYLNRYEGMGTDRIEALAASGDLERLDRISDAAFRRLVPEAEDSVAVVDPELCRIVDVTASRDADTQPGDRDETGIDAEP